MKHDQLEKWEQIPLGLLMAAQGLVVFRWYAGDQLPAPVSLVLPWVTTFFAILAAVALDLVVVTTTMGRREGRESFWSWCTAGAAALFSAGVALDVYGGFSAGPYLHVAYPAVTFVYMQHLAQPKKPLHEPQRAANGAPSEPYAEYQNGHHGALEDTTEALIVDGSVTYRAKCRRCGQRHARLQDYRNCRGIPAANASD